MPKLSISYTIRVSTRSKYARITIQPSGEVMITQPLRMSDKKLMTWLKQKESWIQDTQQNTQKSNDKFEKTHGKRIPLPKLRRGTKEYKETIASARTLARDRVLYYAQRQGYNPGTISIRNQKTRWGSCSAQGNLSFNYRIVYLSDELVDYLIVHELAHTKFHNHSKAFWEEVSRLIPDYKEQRRQLHRYSF